MKINQSTHTYVVLLRGINVGGHHKVPMAELREELSGLGFTNIITLLNSGNIIFDTTKTSIDKLEFLIAEDLEEHFGFPVPAVIRKAEDIIKIQESEPFKDIQVTKNIRLYASFLKQEPTHHLSLPWTSADSFQILDVKDKTIFSVLDLSATKTPKGMDALEQLFGREITTRSWNTLVRIYNKL